MRKIHATAVVDPKARIADDVEIGPYCVVDGPVSIGAHTSLRAHVTVLGDTTIGEGNVVHPGAVLGAAPQDLKHAGALTRLVVGDRNQIREHVTFHAGTVKGGGVTTVGSDGMFMVGCHVAHDGRIGNGVILANHVLLAGHVTVGDRAVLNGAAACHHFTTIGRLAYVGGLTRITRDIPPFTIAEGHPVRLRAANVVGMRRAGIPEASVAVLKRAIHRIFVREEEKAADAMAALLAEHPDDPFVAELVAFVRAGASGRFGRSQERPSSPPAPRPPASGSAARRDPSEAPPR